MKAWRRGLIERRRPRTHSYSNNAGMAAASAGSGPFCWQFKPKIPSVSLVYLNETLIADPVGVVNDAIAQLVGSGAVVSSYMYAGSTPQGNGRRSAFVGPMGDGRAAILGTVLMASGATWLLQVPELAHLK